ncbi:response regulator transcription factor [Actinomadura barringtoniae]|uniref:Response regulator transcription factor n=1 Tax=Actinomadura barringtoniae TaxID=1427535 RepID=A0A939P8F2_9ACTN|nr:response regulator transcription factor [Actinomadura barringtoniae]MBO2447615.1 response regulator transcription factor [Actinomadura barringtoniae]
MRLVIADDSGLLRQMLVETFTRRGLQVIGEAGSLPELLRTVEADPPDVVVLDIRMPPDHRDEGLQAAQRIRARHPSVGLLVLSHYAETVYAVRLLDFATGSVGYLVKDRVQDTDRLIDAVHRVAQGEVVVDNEVIQRVMRRNRTVDPLRDLTPSETQVLALMAEGRSNSAIARELNYSPKTVEKRITAVSRKLGLPQDDERSDINLRVLAVLRYLRNA